MDEKKKINWPKIAIIAGIVFVVLLLLIAGATWFYLKNKKDTANSGILATVGGKQITQTDLNERLYSLRDFSGSIATPPEASEQEKKDAFKELVQWRLVEIEAEESNITISDSELREYKLENVGNYEKMGGDVLKAVDNYQYHKLLIQKIREEANSASSGKYIIARFDRQMNQDSAKDNPEAIAKDKTYAETLINQISTDLASGKITVDQAIEKTINDKVIGAPAYLPDRTMQSAAYTLTDYQYKDSIFAYSESYDELSKINVGEYTKPFLVKGKFTDPANKEGEEAKYIQKDVAYVIINPLTLQKREYSNLEEFYVKKSQEVEIIVNNSLYNEYANIVSKSIFGVKEAHAIDSPFSNPELLGVTTGSSSSSAGFVTGFFKHTSASDTWISSGQYRLSRRDSGSSSGDSILRWGNSPTCTDTAKTFSLGGDIYTGPLTVSDRCTKPSTTPASTSKTGISVLGYGDSENKGNGYTLDCSWNYRIDFSISATDSTGVANPSIDSNHETGHWERAYSFGWDTTANWTDEDEDKLVKMHDFTVDNGKTRKLFFRYNVEWLNENPETTATVSTLTEMGENNLAEIQFQTKAVDNNSDDVATKVIYKKQGDNQWYGFGSQSSWTENISGTDYTVKGISQSSTNTPAYNVNTHDIASSTSGSGWRSVNLDSGSYPSYVIGNSGTERSNGYVWLDAGTYDYMYRAVDVHGGLEDWQTGEFTIDEGTTPPPPGSEPDPRCTISVTPDKGLVPLSVKATITYSDMTSPKFEYDFEPASGYEYTNRGSAVYWTYQNAGTYSVSGRAKDGDNYYNCDNAPVTVTVTNSNNSSGGETAP